MAIVVSAGEIRDLAPAWSPMRTYGSMRLYNNYSRTYAALYREQPNVRVCVDFLSRNIAQLGLHVFRRVSDTDRKRLTDHPLARIIKRPLPREFKLTRYRLVEGLISDMGIYFNAYLLKVRIDGAVMGLLPVPPDLVTPVGGLVIKGYEVDLGTKRLKLGPADLVHFRGYNPENRIAGLPPLETLRRILAEEHAAGTYREGLWKNAAKMYGIVERPATAPEWSSQARERFREEFGALYAGGEDLQESGKTGVLEEGMTWKPIQFNSQETEYLGGRKLTREECARAYHIPLPLVGILDNATFSNIKEQHKHLYQDCLGPWLRMIEEDVELQLLGDFPDSDDVYCEFNIAEKLAGSFEEQMTSFSTAVGRPYMTADEARGRLNMPSLGGDAARLVTPLNVLVGGQASPRDSAPDDTAPKGLLPPGRKDDPPGGIDGYRPEYRRRHEEKWAEVLARHYRRQEAAVLSRLPKAAAGGERKVDVAGVWWDEERWNAELGADLFRLNNLTAEDWAKAVATAAGAEVDPDQMLGWLSEHSRIQAEQINGQMRDELEQALNGPDPLEAVKALFLAAATTWAWRQAQTGVGTAANFGAAEGARAGGLKSKTWRTNSKKPRATHAAMSGVTVEIGKLFPNGMRWPGDPAGGAEEVANCQCSVVFNK